MHAKRKSGFSLIEVNMAIFVMATGVLAIAALYPLGLRESIESQADFKQVMFADYVLNVAVAAASNPNVSWTEWSAWANNYHTADVREGKPLNANLSRDDCVPDFIWERGGLKTAIRDYSIAQGAVSSEHERNKTYAIYCVLVPGFSDQTMGIMVRSLDMNTREMGDREMIRRLEAQPLYYAEARFQGTL